MNELRDSAGPLLPLRPADGRRSLLIATLQKQERSNGYTTLAMMSMVLLLTLASGSIRAQRVKTYPILGSCEASADAFPPGRYMMMKDALGVMAQDYHATVSSVVEAHLKNRQIQCSGTVTDVPSPALASLAMKLPPWKDPEDRAGLTEDDIGAVLLEYVRLYECALKQEKFFLPSRVADDVAKDGIVKIYDHVTTMADRQKRIQQELFLARTALNRTLTYIGGVDRLRPVDSSLECLQRSSLDIRNLLGLAADASACLPRAWDARTTLRDPVSSSSSASSRP